MKKNIVLLLVIMSLSGCTTINFEGASYLRNTDGTFVTSNVKVVKLSFSDVFSGLIASMIGRVTEGISTEKIVSIVKDLLVKDKAASVPVATAGPAPVVQPAVTSPTQEGYEKRFHHTTTATKKDGGKSLIMCPGQRMNFDKCESDGVVIPKHNDDEGREAYWNQTDEPVGDINCTKDGKIYKYKANKTIVYGDC